MHSADFRSCLRRLFFCIAAALLGCAVWRSAPTLPVDHSMVVDQLVIYSDFALPRQHRLFDELRTLRGKISTKLALPTSDEPIQVYLFRNSERYRYFMREYYPNLPDRRAFFLQTDTSLAVYAHWGDRVAEDLRHEVSHAYMHSVVPEIPIWLDEGLAENFEVSFLAHGRNRPHLELLLAAMQEGKWTPNLARLESLADVSQMQQMDYAESWAWVHWLLETTPENRQILVDCLGQHRRREPPSRLSNRLSRGAEQTLVLYLKGLASG